MTPRPAFLVAAAFLTLSSLAYAHDHWISQGGFRNTVGEWCCGAGDCFSIPGENISISAGGYVVRNLNEVVPFSEAQPSPDGGYWRCKRPDGSRRCFFAPPPST